MVPDLFFNLDNLAYLYSSGRTCIVLYKYSTCQESDVISVISMELRWSTVIRLLVKYP